MNDNGPFESEDVNHVMDLFLKQLKEILDETCPVKKISLRRYQSPNKPWITEGMLRSIKFKTQLFRRQLNCPSDENISEFKRYKSQLSKILRLEKKNYYEREFEKVRFSPKKTWFLINEFLSKRKDQSFPDEICMPENQVPFNDKKEIADALNRHFAKIGEKTAESAASSGSSSQNKNDFRNFLLPSHDKSIFLTPVSEQELKNVVTLLKNGHSEGIDGSSTFLLKEILSPKFCTFYVI